MGKQNGFTIVEAMIVIIIIAILAAIVIVALSPINHDPASCAQYSNYSLKDIPARCVNYFNGGR